MIGSAPFSHPLRLGCGFKADDGHCELFFEIEDMHGYGDNPDSGIPVIVHCLENFIKVWGGLSCVGYTRPFILRKKGEEEDIYTEWLIEISDFIRRRSAKKVGQVAKRVLSDPGHAICRRRLLNEFYDLSDFRR